MTGAARWMRTLAVLTLMLVGALLVPPAAGAVSRPTAQDTTTDPLQVELTSVTPGAIPKKGPIVLEGIVRNSTDEPWTGLNVYPLASPGPMTTREQVDAAAVSDPETTSIGERILADGTSIGDLAPGASSTFNVRVRQADLRSRISGAPGVYWIGVQVLGQNADGRDLVADGRARAFIPLVTGQHTAGVSLVVPLRREVRYAADGSLLRDTEIAGALGPDGRLGRLAALGKQAGARPLTWLIDPAVLDAAQAVADGNPPLDLGRASRHPRASKSPSPSTDTTGANGAPAAELTDADQAHAKDWLATVTGLARSGTTLALPYADPDVSAVARLRPSLLAAARSLSGRVFSDRGIDAAPAAAPPDGYLDPDVVDSIGGGDRSATVLLSDHGRPTDDPVEVDQARRFVYADARTAEGGPSPGDRVGALELRQRILADAALTALAGGQRPLVVALPQDWDPGTYWQQADFFGGLDQTWLTLQDIPSGTPTTEPSATEPASARRAELPVRNLDVAAKLVHTATIVGDVLDHADGQSDRLRAAALGAVSYHARDDPGLARVRVDAVTTAVDDLLDRVRVVGTDFVTLSGSSGVLTVSVVNGLDKPVRVGLRASTGSPDVRIDDVKAVRLAAGQRTTVRLQAHAGGVGVHRVTLSPVTSEGQRFGAPLLFNLRTSQVGRVFWGVLIVFGALLLVMVARRVRQRIGAHRWRQ